MNFWPTIFLNKNKFGSRSKNIVVVVIVDSVVVVNVVVVAMLFVTNHITRHGLQCQTPL